MLIGDKVHPYSNKARITSIIQQYIQYINVSSVAYLNFSSHLGAGLPQTGVPQQLENSFSILDLLPRQCTMNEWPLVCQQQQGLEMILLDRFPFSAGNHGDAFSDESNNFARAA